MSIDIKNQDTMQELPAALEDREGFFDLSVEDTVDPISPKLNGHDNIRLNRGIHSNHDSSSSSSDEEKDITDDISYFPHQFERMPPISSDMCSRTPIKVVEPSTKTRTERIIDSIHKRAPGRIIRRILKCSIAYFISTLFSTIHPLANALGQSPFIVCSGCLFSHPGRTMGAQFDATLTSALGAAVAIAYGLAGCAAATAYNVSHPDSYAGAGINCMFLVVGVFGAQTLRQMFPKLHFFALQFMVVQLFTLTLGVGYKEVPTGLSSQFGLTFLIGNFVSLFVNLIFWPETAVDGLGRTLSQTLFDTKEMLDTITRQFFLDPKSDMMPAKVVDDLAGKMRQGMIKVNSAYKEAKYEISYAYSCSSDLNPIRHSLDRVTKHLTILGGSLKTEQVLFKTTDLVSSDDEEESEHELDANGRRRRKSPASSGEHVDSKSQQSSWQHPHDTLTREMSLRKSALKAANNYMTDGTYARPYETTADTNKDLHVPSNSRSTTVTPTTIETVMYEEEMNEKNVRFEHPSVFLGKLSGPRGSRSIASAVSGYNTDAEEEEDIAEKRKSLTHSIRSIFSTSNPGTPDYHSGKEEDYSDANQNTASSFRSFLNLTRLSGPKTKPPRKSEKTIGSEEKHLLVAYLEKLRDPLLSLAVECASVLDCVRDSLNDQLDLPNDDDTGIQHKSFWRFILHTLQIKRINNAEHLHYLHKKKRDASFLCSCAETMRLRILQFDRCEKDRMQALYKINLSRMRGERLDLNVREELFLVFFFIFSLREVAIELKQMAQEMKNLQLKTQAEIQANPKQKKKKKRFYMPQVTTQTWRKWFYSNSYQNVQDRGGYSFSYLQHHLPADVTQRDMEDEYRLTQLATNRNNDNHSSDEGSTSTQRTRNRRNNAQDDEFVLTELESGPTPKHSTACEPPPILKLRYKLWLFIRYFQNYEFKFALKLSIAVGALTIPSWIPGYTEWFIAVRGPWAALTVIAIMSPTSGGTLSMGLWRLAGTLIGAFTAWAVLEIDGTNGYLLSGFAFVLALPFFYIHFSTSYSKVSIVTLLTYMVISLSQYVTPLPAYYSMTISTMVWIRATTLIIGLIAALILNWMVWPFVAREAVRKTLASVIGDLGDYYSYVMGTFLYHDEGLFPTKDEFKEAERIERKLEKMLNTCNELLELTDHEPRLKGPFPKEFYKEILVSAHNLLDRMMSLRVALMKMSPEVKKTVRNLDKYLYRRDMVASILLHFYTLSASLKAKIPLPSFMPSARSARQRLLKHRRPEDRPEKLLRYRNLTWFAMACSTEEIIEELEHLTDLVRFIVGESIFTVKARRLEKKGKFRKR